MTINVLRGTLLIFRLKVGGGVWLKRLSVHEGSGVPFSTILGIGAIFWNTQTKKLHIKWCITIRTVRVGGAGGICQTTSWPIYRSMWHKGAPDPCSSGFSPPGFALPHLF